MGAGYLVKLSWARFAWNYWHLLVNLSESTEAWAGVKDGEAQELALILECVPVAAAWPPSERSWLPS